MMKKILVVDDEEHIRWMVKKALNKENYNVIEAENGEKGLVAIEEQGPSLVILDLKMPGMDGLQVLERVKINQPELPVIIITAHGSIDTAIQAMKAGAVDFITKPFDLEELVMQVKKALEINKLIDQVNFLKSELNERYKENVLESNNPQMNEIIKLVKQVAPTDVTVLVTGESGTGKEVIARTIHECSYRKDKNFIAVNCAAIPENLLESELFGYEKGAFTGAANKKPGRFELADGGTLFLDEIGDIPLNMQVKLLRAIQEKSIDRIGSTGSVTVDVRIIAATNRDLAAAVKEGKFREDLYYRLNVISIRVPALRERKEDIAVLAKHFTDKYSSKYNKKVLESETLSILEKYQWPGNIRELQNSIERAVIISEGEKIQPAHLPVEIREESKTTHYAGIEQFQIPDSGISLEEVEKNLILKALIKASNNQSKAAQLLGITRSALIYRMQKYQVPEGE